MKLSECWKGRVVQSEHLDYEGALDRALIGHIESLMKEGGNIKVGIQDIDSNGIWYAYPEDLKPVEG